MTWPNILTCIFKWVDNDPKEISTILPSKHLSFPRRRESRRITLSSLKAPWCSSELRGGTLSSAFVLYRITLQRVSVVGDEAPTFVGVTGALRK